MGDIFVSDRRTDTEFDPKLIEILESRGLQISIDERLHDGVGRLRKLRKRIDSCDAFIIIMTPHSFASRRVQSELRRATQKRKPIFSLWLEGAEPWFTSEATQAYDVRGHKLPDARFYSALEQFVTVHPVASTPSVPEEIVTVKPPANAARPKIGRKVANIMVRLVVFALMIGAVTYVK